jgi:hypothetical protein
MRQGGLPTAANHLAATKGSKCCMQEYYFPAFQDVFAELCSGEAPCGIACIWLSRCPSEAAATNEEQQLAETTV